MTSAPATDAESAAYFIALQQELAGRYSLERELGRGGMGIVYLAREVRLDRPVAIKVLLPAIAGQANVRERFLHEARTAAKLSHPHVVPIFHVDEAGQFVYFVMAFVEGETLGHRVRTRGPLGVPAATRMLREIAWALAYAHLRGLVHGDVKPDNILLDRESGRAMLMDFGLARLAQTSALDADGNIMGSPHFVSPEQVAGDELDGRSDLYSLGVVAYYALSGRLPFGGDAATVVQAHLSKQPPPLADAAPGTPTRLTQAVECCLAKDRADRFPSAEALADAIEHAVEQPREIPAPIRVWAQQGGKRAGAILVGTYGTMSMIGIAVGTGAWWVLPIPVLVVGGLSGLSRMFQTRKVLARGYDIDDLRVSLARFVEQRREELAFEHGHSRATGLGILGAGLTAIGAPVWSVGAFLPVSNALAFERAGMMMTIVGVTLGVLALAVPPVKRFFLKDYGSLSLRFWNSRWGQRMVDVARIGLKRVAAPEHAVHQPTELAIGRATDLLYRALPKPLRRQFRDLPETLRKLEKDAQTMRAQVDQLTAQLAEIERPWHTGAAELEAQRRRTADEVRATRERAAQRLAAAVGALETIRLDLLRLQMGTAPEPTVTQSLTAAIEAARRIGDDVSAVADAQASLDRMLASPRREPERA